MGVFLAGRICVFALALAALKRGVAIAVAYAHIRKQFGPPGKEEIFIMDHLTHQRRLIPAIARAYVLDNGLKYLGIIYESMNEQNKKWYMPIPQE